MTNSFNTSIELAPIIDTYVPQPRVQPKTGAEELTDILSVVNPNLLKFAKQNGLSFLALEYSGHGKSSGKFTRGNISKWSSEVSILIKKIIKNNRFTIIGSSMGAWLAINQFKQFKKVVKGRALLYILNAVQLLHFWPPPL